MSTPRAAAPADGARRSSVERGRGVAAGAHGAQKLFGAFGGGGIAGTGGFFEQVGLRPGRLHALAAGAAELAGGLLIAVGLVTPFAAAALIGVMTAAAH